MLLGGCGLGVLVGKFDHVCLSCSLNSKGVMYMDSHAHFDSNLCPNV